MTDNNNVNFFFEEMQEEKEVIDEKQLLEMINEMNNEMNNEYDNINYVWNEINDETYYNEEYTVKDLLKICEYYGIDNDVKKSKCKKQDIIATIVYFESLSENNEIVEKRNKMWAYMTELLNDNKMKKYLIWN